MSSENKKEEKAKKKARTFKRRVLMIFLPLIVLACGVMAYLVSGRYVSTDNAYVKADKIMISPEVTGMIVAVEAKDNQKVSKGDLLFTVDPVPFRIAQEKAEANLAAAQTQIDEIRAAYRQKQEELKIAQVDATYTQTEYKRQSELGNKVTPQSRIDAARHDRDANVAKVQQLEQEVQVILAKLNGDPDIATADHPLYRQAVAELDAAKLNMARTEVRAPANGVIGSMPHVGAYAPAGVPVLSLVSSDDLWIEANFKETDLTDMVEGQKVKIEVDTYPDYAWEGEIESISPATGSEFSVLPAQNATGNWVKVVQRIAVRIRPFQHEGDPPLRTGMSAEIKVDTGRYPHLPGGALAGEPRKRQEL